MTRRLLLLLPLLALLLAPSSARAEDAPGEPDDAVQVWIAIQGYLPGEEATALLGATRGDEPIVGATVVFTLVNRSTGPDGTTTTTVTDEAGQARLPLVLDDDTTVRGVVLDEDGTELGHATVSHTVVCRCGPWTALSLRGVAARNGDDRVVLDVSDAAVGARADLYRVDASGTAHRIRRSTLGSTGKRAWRVQDHNGRGVTRYFAKVGATETSRAAVSKVVRVR